MALYIPHSIFHLARLLYVRPETFGPYYVKRLQFSVILLTVLCTLLSVTVRCAKQHHLKSIRPLFVFSIRIKPTSVQSNTTYVFSKFSAEGNNCRQAAALKRKENLIIDKIFYTFTFTFES